FRAGRGLAEDAEPGERVLAEVAGARSAHRLARDAVRAVGADDEVRLDLEGGAVGVGGDDPGPVGVGALDAVGGDAEAEVLAVGQSGGDEVAQRLVLRIEPDAAPDEVLEVDAVPGPGEPQLDAVVTVSLDPGRRGHTRVD